MNNDKRSKAINYNHSKMSYIPLSTQGTSPFEKLLGHAPEILNNWSKLENAFFQSNTFEPDFLEQIRRALAFDNLCLYCMEKAGRPDHRPEDMRLSEALRFANIFAIDHKAINEKDMDQLKQYFSPSEISELISYCSFISASQRFGAVLGLQPASAYEQK
ncbi:Uncharacterised protein [Legionella cincinnatiensis]|uniref:Carboxymuconolactone decarboxylase n=2 Tax=Legionella cincinnatiensis TaxID=28085 RepID=A0A378IN69_9GAMM|nr:hypothetical protein Lcin_2639 [Legionella cincinnatiensis]STX36677.1 Uncharacterised protein [Legionella cincinnatiensis]